MHKRKKLSNFQRNTIAHSQKWQCKKCNALLPAAFEIDHILPLWCGGNNEILNLQALCPNCHANKSRSETLLFSKPIVLSKYFLPPSAKHQ